MVCHVCLLKDILVKHELICIVYYKNLGTIIYVCLSDCITTFQSN